MMTFLRRRPLVLSLFTAILLWCAYPGGGEIWPLLPVSLVPLLFSLTLMSGRGAFLAGMAAGTCHYLLQLYWIVTVLGRYGGLPALITVPALLLLAGYMALYVGGVALLARRLLLLGTPLAALLAVPALWVGGDWLRSWLFTGFPWMDIGYAPASAPQLVQLADLFGHGGISFCIVLVNTFITLALVHRHALRRLTAPALVLVAVLSLASYYSARRWQTVMAGITDPAAGSMVVGIVQGNIDQSEKWSPDNQQRTVNTYLDFSRSLFGPIRPELIVWPETALPFYPQTYHDPGVLAGLVAQYDTGLLTGAPWFEVVESSKREIRYYNSAQLLAPGIGFTASYYKSHLVPFGEYVPLRKVLFFLEPLVEAVGDFSFGRVEEPLVWRSGRIGVLICFESIFPDIARKWSRNGANLLVNLTNDAWYGKSSAPYHSMAMTVLRAVETRRSVVRAANTGISGFIDPLGRVHEPSPLFTEWAATREVSLMAEETLFVRWGYLFAPFCLAAGLLLTGWSTGAGRRATNA